MKYFTLEEFYRSATASKFGIINKPLAKKDIDEVEKNLNLLCDNILDPLREKMDAPIYVISGYRCMEMNRRLGGAKNSQHLVGKAADITMNTFPKNLLLADTLLSFELPFDQLILERTDANTFHYSWLHVSFDKDKDRQRGEVLIYYKGEYRIPDTNYKLAMVYISDKIRKNLIKI